MSYPLPKDPQIAAYLQHIRKRNLEEASRCYVCKKQSTGINSDGYRILFVCDDHFEAGVETIILNDMPGVHHQIYPNGLYIGDKLDPNQGGYFPRTSGQTLSETDKK
jgi:hypothetical protein